MKSFGVALGMAAAVATAGATGLANRFFVEAEAGMAWRDLDGPLLSGGGIAPGSRAEFRADSSRMQPFGEARLGLHVSDFLSLRAGYQDFGNTYVKIQRPASFNPGYSLPSDFRFRDVAFTFDPVLTWQVGPRVRFQGYWGVAFNRTDKKIQNYLVISPLSPVVLVGQPLPTPIYFDPGIPDARTFSHLSRAGASVTLDLTARLDLNLGVDYQRLSSYAREAWMAHAGVAYAFDGGERPFDRFYVSFDAGSLWRKLDGPLLTRQPEIYPGSSASYRNGSSNRSAFGAIQFGVKATDWLAIQAGYQDFGTTYVSIREPPGFASIPEYFPPTNFHSRDYVFTLDPVCTWRAGEKLSFRGFWGVAFNHADVVCENQDFSAAISGYLGGVRRGYQAAGSHTVQSRFGADAVMKVLPGFDVRLGEEFQKFSSFAASGWMTHVGITLIF